MASPPVARGMSIMDVRRAAEQKERDELENALADLGYWGHVWATEHPPYFDRLSAPHFVQVYSKDWGIKDNARCLVPGCGRGYSVTALATPQRYVLGVDLCPQAIVLAKERLLAEMAFYDKLEVEAPFPLRNAEFKAQDFFRLGTCHPESLFDFVLDDAFVSMLDPRVWPDWAKKMAALVKVGGSLVVAIHPIMQRDVALGPPYGMSIPAVRDLLVEVGFRMEFVDMLPPHMLRADRGGAGGGVLEGDEACGEEEKAGGGIAGNPNPNPNPSPNRRGALGRFVREADEEKEEEM